MQIRKASKKEVGKVEALYDRVNVYLEHHINYPGWKQGVYPAREDAVRGIAERDLFVALQEERIVGTFILRQQPEKGYELAGWKNDLDYSEIDGYKRQADNSVEILVAL